MGKRSNGKKSNGRPKFNMDKPKTEGTKILFETRIEQLLHEQETGQQDMNQIVRKTTEVISKVVEEILGKVTKGVTNLK